MAHDGTALGALNEIIESAGGTSDAQTLVPAIEDLGEVIAAGGGGGGSIPDGSVTTDKLADGAVTTDKLANRSITSAKIARHAVGFFELDTDAVDTDKMRDGSVTIDKIDDDAKTKLASAILYATDATTAQTLMALGFTVTVLTPQGAHSTGPHMSIRSMLCWIDTSSGYLEKAPIDFSGNLQSQTILLWAKGLHSMASGVLGVDTSWTITANE